MCSSDLDEFTLSDTAQQQTSDTQAFITNIARLFSGHWNESRFLIYSSNSHLQGSCLENSITAFRKNIVVKDASTPLDLKTLLTYEAIFVGGDPVDNQLLIDYIKLGGSVCLIAGTGQGGSQSEGDQWSQLLSAFGLRLDTSYNDITGLHPVTSPTHPLFAGVKSLFQYWGQSIHLLPDSKASILMTSGSHGLIAYASIPVA